MFIFMFIMLTIGQLVVEQQFVQAICDIQAKTPIWRKRKSFGDFHANFVVVNLGFSIGLSVLLATIFPAAGLVVLTSGLVSTMLSRPTARLRHGYRQTKIKAKRAKVRCQHIGIEVRKFGHKAWVATHPIKACAQRVRNGKTLL